MTGHQGAVHDPNQQQKRGTPMGKGTKAGLWVVGGVIALIIGWFVTMAGTFGGGHWY